jgi:hypothetical protein
MRPAARSAIAGRSGSRERTPCSSPYGPARATTSTTWR